MAECCPSCNQPPSCCCCCDPDPTDEINCPKEPEPEPQSEQEQQQEAGAGDQRRGADANMLGNISGEVYIKETFEPHPEPEDDKDDDWVPPPPIVCSACQAQQGVCKKICDKRPPCGCVDHEGKREHRPFAPCNRERCCSPTCYTCWGEYALPKPEGYWLPKECPEPKKICQLQTDDIHCHDPKPDCEVKPTKKWWPCVRCKDAWRPPPIPKKRDCCDAAGGKSDHFPTPTYNSMAVVKSIRGPESSRPVLAVDVVRRGMRCGAGGTNCGPCPEPCNPCNTCNPCNPCYPCGPCGGPLGQCGPCGPCTPCGPCAPAYPACGPCDPCGPCPTDGPCSPCGPCAAGGLGGPCGPPCAPPCCPPCSPMAPMTPVSTCSPCSPCTPTCGPCGIASPCGNPCNPQPPCPCPSPCNPCSPCGPCVPCKPCGNPPTVKEEQITTRRKCYRDGCGPPELLKEEEIMTFKRDIVYEPDPPCCDPCCTPTCTPCCAPITNCMANCSAGRSCGGLNIENPEPRFVPRTEKKCETAGDDSPRSRRCATPAGQDKPVSDFVPVDENEHNPDRCRETPSPTKSPQKETAEPYPGANYGLPDYTIKEGVHYGPKPDGCSPLQGGSTTPAANQATENCSPFRETAGSGRPPVTSCGIPLASPKPFVPMPSSPTYGFCPMPRPTTGPRQNLVAGMDTGAGADSSPRPANSTSPQPQSSQYYPAGYGVQPMNDAVRMIAPLMGLPDQVPRHRPVNPGMQYPNYNPPQPNYNMGMNYGPNYGVPGYNMPGYNTYNRAPGYMQQMGQQMGQPMGPMQQIGPRIGPPVQQLPIGQYSMGNQQGMMGGYQQGMMGGPQQGMMGVPQQGMMGVPQQGMMGIPQQGMMGVPQQGMMGGPQQGMMGAPQGMMGMPQQGMMGQQMSGTRPQMGQQGVMRPHPSVDSVCQPPTTGNQGFQQQQMGSSPRGAGPSASAENRPPTPRPGTRQAQAPRPGTRVPTQGEGVQTQPAPQESTPSSGAAIPLGPPPPADAQMGKGAESSLGQQQYSQPCSEFGDTTSGPIGMFRDPSAQEHLAASGDPPRLRGSGAMSSPPPSSPGSPRPTTGAAAAAAAARNDDKNSGESCKLNCAVN